MTRAGWQRRVATPLLWLLLVAAAVYVLSIYARPQPGHSVWWDDWYYDGVLWSAALLTGWGARWGPQRGVGTSALAAAMVLYATGNTCWSAWVSHLPDPPYPSIADYLWLSFYPLTFVAIWFLAGSRDDRGGRGGRGGHGSGGLLQGIDGLVGALAVAAVGLLVSVGPIAHNVTGSPAAVVVNLAYPVGDLGLLVLLISLTAASGRRPPLAWLLLGVSLILWAVADSTYVFQVADGSYRQGTLLDAGWLVPAALLPWVPWARSRTATTDTTDTSGQPARPASTLLLPALLAAVVVALLVKQSWGEAPWFGLLAGTTLAAAGARLVLSVREVERLAGAQAEARTDELTGLGNRRAFLEALHSNLAGGERFRLLLMDLDGFKNVNDTLGHSAGDICLQTIATRMTSLCDSRRGLYRLGGDEFAILTTAADRDVTILAERLQAAVARPVSIGDQTVQVATSIGILTCPDQASTPTQALRRADTAMYHAKTHRLGSARYSAESDRDDVRVQTLADDAPQPLGMSRPTPNVAVIDPSSPAAPRSAPHVRAKALCSRWVMW